MKAKTRLPHERGIRARIRTDGTTCYQLRWEDDIATRSQTFASLEEAIAYREKVERKKRTGSYTSPSDWTVTDLVADYLGRLSADGISANSLLTYDSRKRTMIDPLIGRLRIHTLTPLDVQRWVDQLGKAGFKTNTIKSALMVLRPALKHATRLGMIESNPSTVTRTPKARSSTIKTWTPDEVRRVLSVLETDELFGMITYLAIATAMRPGELIALHWKDVDFARGTILVRATLSRNADGQAEITSKTKTKRDREIAIVPETMERLKWHRARQRERQIAHPKWQESGLVFDRGNGRFIYPDLWSKARKRIAELSGVDKIRAHDYRHTSITLELAAGTNPKIVSERAGHSSITMTLGLYSHVSSDLQRAAADRFSKLFLEEEPVAKGS